MNYQLILNYNKVHRAELALIVRDLYGLKSAGADFRNHLAECMKHLGCHPCRSDRDLWMKAETRPDDGVLYWAYILIHFMCAS
jgi:hypothetical protein